jgi:menaquinone-9 beta-reductase
VQRALGPAAVAESVHRAWPIPARIDDVALTTSRALFVGDAAAATDVMTGEGIGQALATGRLAAQAIIDGSPDERIVRSRYELAVARALFADHRLSHRLQPVLAHGRSADLAVHLAGLTAWTRRNFARWLLEDYPRAILLTPRRWQRAALRQPGAFR